MNGAIWDAYRDTGTLDIACPHCDATPGTFCTRPDGRVRRVPCIDRIAASGAVPDVRDYTEPRHQRREQIND
jgi:hypothetical protein